ncbi:MAG: prolipoprotein diacylglyceryl transferase [Crocinitomicaceae bacterium]|nr:prolipoprotein diacylglyceryl transferase [Crocinitomicaceae bacterium]
MKIPFEPEIFDVKINIHLILEYLAFFIAFRYYLILRKTSNDSISNGNRLSIILGAVLGALAGSRIIGFLENPDITLSTENLLALYNLKSIMGGLFGGLIGVEAAKKIIHEKQSSGDLFTFPIITGIIIGRIGCFLSGINEFTYGKETDFIAGMDLGDGLYRHPTALYEIIFLIMLFIFLKNKNSNTKKESGLLFKVFMISYFGFRFVIEFIKPNTFFVFGLSSIQWLCIICWIYYFPVLKRITRNAN